MWLHTLWQRWMGRTSRQLRRRRPQQTRTRLTLERLENRTLLSGGITTTTGLVSAINNANATGGAVTITLASGATFDFTSPYQSTQNALPIITGNITILGEGATIERTGAQTFRLFDVAGGGSLNLQDLTLQGGLAQGTGAAADGGAIYSSGMLTLSGVTMRNNKAHGNNGAGASAFGGGVYVAAGAATLTNDTLSGNEAVGGNGGSGALGVHVASNGGAGSGGGLYVAAGTVTLSNDTFSSNNAVGGRGGENAPSGGGLNGGAGSGGGVFVSAGTVTLSNDTLSGNEAAGGDGGAGFVGGNGGAGSGGGLYLARSSVTLINDTLSGNEAVGGNGASGEFGGGNGGTGTGGSVYAAAGAVTLNSDTLSGNEAVGGNGGGVGFGGVGGIGGSSGSNGNGVGGGVFNYDGNVTLNNTIVANSTSGGDLYLDSADGGSYSGAYDLIGDGSDLGSFTHSRQGNPLLAPLGNYGGPAQTMTLLPGSPAIDAGNGSLAGLARTDQRGYARIAGNAADIGADEYQYDLAISGSAPSSVVSGQTITYQITVTNNGPDSAGNGGGIVLSDVLPSGVTFVSAQSSAGLALQNGTVTAVIATLNPGASAMFTVVVQTSSSTPNSVSNTIAVGPAAWDTNTINNSLPLTTTVVNAGPVNVSADVSVRRGGFRYDFATREFVQTITITNTSSSALVGPLALQLTNLSSNATLINANGAYNGNPYVDLVPSSGELAAGQSITVTLYFKDPTFQAICYGTQAWQGLP